MSESQHVDTYEKNLCILVSLRLDDDDQAGNALKELFGIYGNAMIRYASRTMGKQDIAHDVVQDVFINIWQRRRELPEGDLAAYLFRSVRNRSLKALAHDRVVEKWEVYVRLQASEHELNQPIDSHKALEIAELSEQLNAALATISPRSREIVQLCHQEGLKPGQVADMLGISPTTVYSVLSRSLKQLSEHLGKK